MLLFYKLYLGWSGERWKANFWNRLLWFQPHAANSPGRNLCHHSGSQRRSCSVWSWSSRSTSSWGRCSHPQLSVRERADSSWGRSRPSRWLCIQCLDPAGLGSNLATWQYPPRNWFLLVCATKSRRSMQVVSTVCNAHNKVSISLTFVWRLFIMKTSKPQQLNIYIRLVGTGFGLKARIKKDHS